jgi:hypothetical protein
MRPSEQLFDSCLLDIEKNNGKLWKYQYLMWLVTLMTLMDLVREEHLRFL